MNKVRSFYKSYILYTFENQNQNLLYLNVMSGNSKYLNIEATLLKISLFIARTGILTLNGAYLIFTAGLISSEHAKSCTS